MTVSKVFVLVVLLLSIQNLPYSAAADVAYMLDSGLPWVGAASAVRVPLDFTVLAVEFAMPVSLPAEGWLP